MNLEIFGTDLAEINRIILLLLLIGCAVAVNLTKNLLQAVIIFMSYSSIMCLLWILMESPDLAITEAAVGAGVSGYLFLVTLKKIRQMDDARQTESSEMDSHDIGDQNSRAPKRNILTGRKKGKQT